MSEAGSSVSTTATTTTSPNSVFYGAATAYTIQFMPDVAGDLDLVSFIVPAGSGSTVSAPITLAGTTSAGNIYIAAVSNLADAMITTTGTLTATSAASVGGNIVLSAGGGIASALPGAPSGAVVDAALGAASADQGASVTASGPITLTDNISAGVNALTLSSGAAISQSGGVITAGTLNASATTGITLNDANAVTSLGAVSNFTFPTSGGISFTNAGSLALSANITAYGQTVSLVSNTGALTQSAGVISADTLNASAATGISLNGANNIGFLGIVTNSTSGGIGVTDAYTLTLSDNLTAAGQTVNLVSSAGQVLQSGGIITAGTLNVASQLGVGLPSANAVTNLGAVSSSAVGGIGFTNAGNLILTGNLSAPGLPIGLTSNTGSITQASGIITADAFGVSAATGITLNDANVVTSIGMGTTSGAISFTNAGDFSLGDDVFAPSQSVSLTSNTGAITQAAGAVIIAGTLNASAKTGITLNGANAVALGVVSNSTSGGISAADAGSLALTGNVTAAGQAVSLTAYTGALTQSAGVITATTLNASAVTGVTLGGANAVTNLGAISNTQSGGIGIADAGDMTLTGAVSAPAQAVALASNTGAINQAGGVITANTLTASAVTGLSLRTDANQVTNVGSLTNTPSGGMYFTKVGDINMTTNIAEACQ